MEVLIMAQHKKVSLTKADRARLESFVNKGVHSTHIVKRAQVILSLDSSSERKPQTRAKVAEVVQLSPTAVTNIKNDWFALNNIEKFLRRKQRETPPVQPKITGSVQAHIIALACTEPPSGYSRWTLQLLADKSVELKFIDSISNVSVETVLKKINFSLISANTGVFRLSKMPNL
jgi:hypothetical protein